MIVPCRPPNITLSIRYKSSPIITISELSAAPVGKLAMVGTYDEALKANDDTINKFLKLQKEDFGK